MSRPREPGEGSAARMGCSSRHAPPLDAEGRAQTSVEGAIADRRIDLVPDEDAHDALSVWPGHHLLVGRDLRPGLIDDLDLEIDIPAAAQPIERNDRLGAGLADEADLGPRDDATLRGRRDL